MSKQMDKYKVQSDEKNKLLYYRVVWCWIRDATSKKECHKLVQGKNKGS